MKKFNLSKKNFVLSFIVAVLLWMIVPYLGVKFCTHPEVKEGDIIFHCSTSSQSPLIALATGSPLTHCGVIVMKNGEPYVLEASGTLRVTPLARFIKRGRFGAYWLKRPKDVENVKIRYAHLLGRRYDLAFSFNNDKYYCSELVYDIYKYRQNVELCKPKPISSYFTLGMKRTMKRRGMNPDGLVVAPSDIFSSNKLTSI